MNPYGKVAQAAIAAASLLAEHYGDQPRTVFNSREIAARRNLSQALIAKVLTTLSQAGIVTGAPGPGGGYSLAQPPDSVSLAQIVGLFDRKQESLGCPYGPGWCGTGPQCPLHLELEQLRRKLADCLEHSTLAAFVKTTPATRPPRAASKSRK
jgi:Rrf2 family iron-sulfur cluster assembly transcriptional regulator